MKMIGRDERGNPMWKPDNWSEKGYPKAKEEEKEEPKEEAKPKEIKSKKK